MIELGRLCLKIAGRDAGKHCIVVDLLDNNLVLIDGETRRKKCNIKHLEPLDKTIKIKKNASHDEIKSEFKKLKLKVLETKPKPKTEKPKKQRGKKKEEEPKEVKKERKGILKRKAKEKPKTEDKKEDKDKK